MPKPIYTQEEERLNYWTHGLATLASFIGLILLIQKALPYNDIGILIGILIFGLCMTGGFLSSTLYHYIEPGDNKTTFRLLDHLAIYLFIAGSYTPFTLITFRAYFGLFAVATIWTLAIFGMSFKFYIRKKLDKYTRVDALMYTVLGCLALFFIKPIITHLPLECVVLLLLGGAAYLIGVIFYLWKSFPYNHAVWHLFVIMGAAFHFVCVYGFVLS